VCISDGTIMAGSLPQNAARLIRDWVALRQAELVADWQTGVGPRPVHCSCGLDALVARHDVDAATVHVPDSDEVRNAPNVLARFTGCQRR